ncbi:DUF6011 domain-containing protein [Mycobacterium sp. Root265]|uniref:DUF6011 domain-containing protein n=1 Tax=Mycobacterium sp. Root265 TaxID=1736504 RepID=UPI003FA56C89
MTDNNEVAPGSNAGGTPSSDWRIARRCSVCRRWLTAPNSVAAGAGPTCRGDRG